MTSLIGNRPPPSFNTAARMSLSTGFKLGVNGQSSSDEVAKALSQLVDEKTAQGYAYMAEGLGGKYKGDLLRKVEEEMGKFIKGGCARAAGFHPGLEGDGIARPTTSVILGDSRRIDE